ncbi:glutathione S-transferase family protein [Falsiroseomonas sp. HW251]|uniref:glutathione S-transferase family protein n=1 Tax=Falsiroseomonas sp. HW251 TaxID=3390998 RepID=UPI003D31F5CB
MLTIWGRTSSSNVMKVLWACEELGIAFERIDAGGAFGRTQDAGYLAMNPNALVPTIQDGDFTLWESNSILRYLARTRAPGGAILPADPKAAADCERWMDWQLSALNAPMTTIFFTYVRTPEPERDMAATAKARDAAEKLWAMVDARLGAGDYVCGAALTLADIVLGVYAWRWFNLPIERAPMPRLEAWFERLKTRPGYAKHVALPMT